ncbi:MAG: 50S ribosomal protein L18 [Candidatus Kapabacteria bacterium]|nr:50S ribosomal protein L18 [Candidatus Kapabacteria bacterium]
MSRIEIKNKRRHRRKMQIRNKILGAGDRHRMTITRSLNNIFVQIIDDKSSSTIVSASTIDKEVKGMITSEMKKLDKGKLVGAVVAKRALEKNIIKVVFDRNGYLYHGRVKAVADAARLAGLQF